MANVDAVLAERGARYGDFKDHARIAQQIQDTFRQAQGWNRLNYVQAQALTVIADKIARILSGDPNYDDNWIDIQGYAKLVQDRLYKVDVAIPAPWEPQMMDAPCVPAPWPHYGQAKDVAVPEPERIQIGQAYDGYAEPGQFRNGF